MIFRTIHPVGSKNPIRVNIEQLVSVEPHIPDPDDDEDDYSVTLTFSNNSVYVLPMSDGEFYDNYIPH